MKHQMMMDTVKDMIAKEKLIWNKDIAVCILNIKSKLYSVNLMCGRVHDTYSNYLELKKPKPVIAACGTEKTADVKDRIHSAMVLRLEDWIAEAIPTPPVATKMTPHQIPSPIPPLLPCGSDSSATCIIEMLHKKFLI